MSKLTESTIEEFALELFQQLGYSYLYGPDIATDGKHPERQHYDEVLLVGWSFASGANAHQSNGLASGVTHRIKRGAA